jgi:hypothetical protein
MMCAGLLLAGVSACSKSDPEDGGDGGATPPADAPAAAPSSSAAVAMLGGRGLTPGLWTTTMKTSMGPSMDMKMCVDEAMSTQYQNFGPAKANTKDCTQQSLVRTGDDLDMTMVCKTKGQTVNMKVHMTIGATSYHQDIDQTFEPAMAGMNGMHMSVDGTYGGACPAGMKGGDVTVAGMTTNVHAAAKG